jgi:hypothetical protein
MKEIFLAVIFMINGQTAMMDGTHVNILTWNHVTSKKNSWNTMLSLPKDYLKLVRYTVVPKNKYNIRFAY